MAPQQLLPLPIQRPCLFPCKSMHRSQRTATIPKPTLLYCLSSGSGCETGNGPARIMPDEIPPNALRRKLDPLWRGGFSLGVDFGLSRTGLALGKGFSPRPLTVLELRGHKLELQLLEIAEREEADEFIFGLPKAHDGRETPQSNKVRSVAGRFAVQAAERALDYRVCPPNLKGFTDTSLYGVYFSKDRGVLIVGLCTGSSDVFQKESIGCCTSDEHGTSMDALDSMIDLGVKKYARRRRVDAFAALMVLERYFSTSGYGAELVIPKQLDLQKKLLRGPTKDEDFYPENVEA